MLIDTPPTDTAEARLAVRHANLVLIPSRPDLWDVLAIETAWGMTRDEKKLAWVVLNACPPASPGMTKDALATLASTRVEVSPQRINHRVAFGYAKNDGRGVAEYEPDGKAAEEMNSLFDWTMKRLDLNASKRKAAYREGLGDLELCRSLTGLFDPIHDCRCFNCTQAGSIK